MCVIGESEKMTVDRHGSNCRCQLKGSVFLLKVSVTRELTVVGFSFTDQHKKNLHCFTCQYPLQEFSKKPGKLTKTEI